MKTSPCCPPVLPFTTEEIVFVDYVGIANRLKVSRKTVSAVFNNRSFNPRVRKAVCRAIREGKRRLQLTTPAQQ